MMAIFKILKYTKTGQSRFSLRAESHQKYTLCQKFLQIKVVRNQILRKKFTERICLSPPGVCLSLLPMYLRAFSHTAVESSEYSTFYRAVTKCHHYQCTYIIHLVAPWSKFPNAELSTSMRLSELLTTVQPNVSVQLIFPLGTFNPWWDG